MPHPVLKDRAVADLQAAVNLHREQQALEESAQNDSQHHGRALEVAGESASASQFESQKRRSSASSEGGSAYATHSNKKLRLATMPEVPDVPVLDESLSVEFPPVASTSAEEPGLTSEVNEHNRISVIQHAPVVVRNPLSIAAESMAPSACSSSMAAPSASHTSFVSDVARDMPPVQESTETLEVLFDRLEDVRLIDEVWKSLELDIKKNPGSRERKRRTEHRGGPYRLMINGSVCVPTLSTKNVPTIHLIFGRNADYIQTLIIEVTRLDGSFHTSEQHTFPVTDEAALKKRILFQATVEAKKFVEDPEHFRGARILSEGCSTTYSLCKRIANSLPSPMTGKELGNRMGIINPVLNKWMGYASVKAAPVTPLVSFNVPRNAAPMEGVSLLQRGNASNLRSLLPQPQ